MRALQPIFRSFSDLRPSSRTAIWRIRWSRAVNPLLRYLPSILKKQAACAQGTSIFSQHDRYFSRSWQSQMFVGFTHKKALSIYFVTLAPANESGDNDFKLKQ